MKYGSLIRYFCVKTKRKWRFMFYDVIYAVYGVVLIFLSSADYDFWCNEATSIVLAFSGSSSLSLNNFAWKTMAFTVTILIINYDSFQKLFISMQVHCNDNTKKREEIFDFMSIATSESVMEEMLKGGVS